MAVKKINKCLLINPPTGLYIREDRCQSSINDLPTIEMRPPMDLASMAASLEKESVVCRIVDCPMEKIGWNGLNNILAEFYPDLLVVNTTTSTLEDDLMSCDLAKRMNQEIITVAKGAIFFQEDEQVLQSFKNLDVAIRGETNGVLEEVARCFDLSDIAGITFRSGDKIVRNADRPFLENLDELPFPSRHLINNELYTRMDTGRPQTTIETARGCPGQCIFCLSHQVSGYRLRYRTPESVVTEVKECVRKYGISDFHFRTDTFTANKAWVLSLCRRFIEEKLNINWVCTSRVNSVDEEMLAVMKKAGCWGISFGVESGSQQMLDLMKKEITIGQVKNVFAMCRKYKIDSFAYFLIGLPWETEETVNESIRLAIELNPSIAEFFIVYPFPGTEFYDIAQKEGLIKEKGFKRPGAYSQPAIDTLFLKKERLVELRQKALRKFYLRSRYMLTLFRRIRSKREMINYLSRGYKALKVFYR